MRPATLISALAVIIGGALLGFAPPIGALEPVAVRTSGAIVLAIGLWSTAVMPAHFTSLLFMLVAMLFALAPAQIVFSGFHAGAIWLVFSGIVLSVAIRETGLGGRIAGFMLRRLPDNYLALCYAVFILALILDFLIPAAVARVLLLTPIVIALCDRVGFDQDRKGRTGIILAAVTGTMTPAFAILPGNVPNMAMSGSAESIYQISFSYGQYFLLNFPVMGTLATVIYPPLIWAMFRDTPQRSREISSRKAWSAQEARLLAVVAIALCLWITDFAHGVAPAWVSMTAALFILLPRVGVLPPVALTRDVDFGPVLFVAGIIGLGAVATETGLARSMADSMLAVVALTPDQDAWNFAAITGMGMAVGILTTLPASPAIMTSLAPTIADAAGWSLPSVLMAQVGAWMMHPFPYQAPPVVIVIALARLRIGSVMKLLVAYMVLALLIIMPIQFFWGSWLGYYS
jgi:di/tricarboxylate transporter